MQASHISFHILASNKFANKPEDEICTNAFQYYGDRRFHSSNLSFQENDLNPEFPIRKSAQSYCKTFHYHSNRLPETVYSVCV